MFISTTIIILGGGPGQLGLLCLLSRSRSVRAPGALGPCSCDKKAGSFAFVRFKKTKKCSVSAIR